MPHQCGSRAAKVAFTSFVAARRRLSRVMKCRRTCRNAASDCSPVFTIARIPMFVPNANTSSSSRLRSVSPVDHLAGGHRGELGREVGEEPHCNHGPI